MSESREAPEAPQVETLENPNELPAASREESIEEGAAAVLEPQTLENPHAPTPVAEEAAGVTLDDDAAAPELGVTPTGQTFDNPHAPPMAEDETAGVTLDDAAALEVVVTYAGQTFENPHAPALAIDEAAGVTLEDAPPPPPVATAKIETLENPHAPPAPRVEPAGSTVQQQPPAPTVPNVPALFLGGMELPKRPRLRTSFWYEPSGQLRCELVMMTEGRDLVHRETFDVQPGSVFAQLQELVAGVATVRAQHTGRVVSTRARQRVTADTLIENTQPDPTDSD